MNRLQKTSILEKIHFLYKTNKVVRWSSTSENAQLVIKNAWRFTSVFEMLSTIVFSSDLCLHKENNDANENQLGISNLEIILFPYYKTNTTQIEYFNTLFVSTFQYHQFVGSALVYVISNYVKFNKEAQISFLATLIVPVFLENTKVSTHVFKLIKYIELFEVFFSESLDGLINFFSFIELQNIKIIQEKYTYPSWSFYLQFFSYFPISFVEECIQDCELEHNLAPLFLALLNYQFILIKNPSNLQIQKFETLKKLLVKNKLLSAAFLIKCNTGCFKDKQSNEKFKFSVFYSSFNSKKGK